MLVSPAPEKEIKRQEISPGIFIEKYQEKVKETPYYVINVESKLFQMLEFTVDFTGSTNVVLEGSSGLTKETVIPPFTKTEVARLALSKKWNLKTKFKFALNLPSIEEQRERLKAYVATLRTRITQAVEFNRMDLASIKPEELLETIAKYKIEFVDTNFQPGDRSLVSGSDKVEDRFECLVHWRKGKEADAQSDPTVKMIPIYETEPLSENVRHGKLNDGAVVSAIAALAEYPKLVHRIILSKLPNEQGIYKLKLCHVGRWQQAVVDDYFPCFPLGGPIFARSERKELWVMLLEKLFAKKYEGYQNLIYLKYDDAMADVTGCPVFSESIEAAASQDDRLLDDLWKKLVEWRSKKYLVTADTKFFQGQTEDPSVAKNFTYSLIKTIEIPHNRFPIPGKTSFETTRLLCLRNLWNLFEWSGDWSADSKLWTPEIKAEFEIDLDPARKTVWIPLDNFTENFHTLHVCKTQKWHELRTKGKFVSGIDQNNPKISHFCSRWYYQLELTEPAHVVFGLHQDDDRVPTIGKTRPLVDLGLSILKRERDAYVLLDYHETDFVRQDFLEAQLEPGSYVILPRSVGVSLEFDEGANEVTNFSRDNPLVVSVIEDIFEKYDLFNYGFLSMDELSSFYQFIGRNLTQAEYQGIIKTYKANPYSLEFHQGIIKEWFVRHFFTLIEKMSVHEIQSLFEKLGYKKNLFSNRTRLFNLTLHSDIFLNLTVKDALVDNIDFECLKLLIRKHGTSINEGSGDDTKEVQGYFYFNK